MSRFLLVNVARIGDTLLATPAIRAIRVAHPDAEITCLGHPKRVAVLEHLPLIDHLGAISKRRAPFMGRIKPRRQDYALVWGNDRPLFDYAFRIAGKVVGFTQEDDDLNRRLHRAVAKPKGDVMPAVEKSLLLTDALDIPHAGRELAYQVSAGETSIATAWLRKRNIRHWPLVGLQLACFGTKAYRDWPLASFVELGKALAFHFPDTSFLLFGTGKDQERVSRFAAALGPRAHSLVGLSLRQAAALMAHVDLYVGPDTGPTHLAGALRVPMVGLYHCLHPSRFLAPASYPGRRVVDLAPGDCSEARSVAEIPMQTVLDHAMELLHP